MQAASRIGDLTEYWVVMFLSTVTDANDTSQVMMYANVTAFRMKLVNETETVRVFQTMSFQKTGTFKLPWFTRSIYLMHAFCPALWRPVRCKHILPLCTSWSLWWLMTAENTRLKIRRRREPFYSSIILSIRRNHKFSSAEKKQTVAQGRSTRQISFKWSDTRVCYPQS